MAFTIDVIYSATEESAGGAEDLWQNHYLDAAGFPGNWNA
jgi:hypothetical protein